MGPKYKNGFSVPSTVSPISNRMSVLRLKNADSAVTLSGHRIPVSPNALRQYWKKVSQSSSPLHTPGCHSNCISGWRRRECKWHIHCLHSYMSGPSPSAHSHTSQHTPAWEGMDTSALHYPIATNSPYREMAVISNTSSWKLKLGYSWLYWCMNYIACEVMSC